MQVMVGREVPAADAGRILADDPRVNRVQCRRYIVGTLDDDGFGCDEVKR